jgi:hypothetical protein
VAKIRPSLLPHERWQGWGCARNSDPRQFMTSIDATQRKFIVGILVATLLTFGVVIGDLSIGGRPDPTELRAAATLLDGTWRFHIGDDLHWAASNFDDSDWETFDMTARPGSHDGDVGLPDYVGGWMAHGHPGYHGYAWYRRIVRVPSDHASWDVLGPTLVEDGYELYWNGQRLGGSGDLGSNPRVVGTRPLQFALPADAAGNRGLLAVRTYKLPGGASADGGGMHSPPILAPQPVSDALHRVQWQRSIAGYILEVIEPLAMIAAIALALIYRSRSTRPAFLVLTCIALALMAERRLNNAIVAWTDLMDLPTYAWLASIMWVPVVAAWTFAWNRWCGRPWRSVDVLALVLAVAGTIGSLYSADAKAFSRVGSIVLFVVIIARIVRTGPMRVLATLTLISILLTLFGGELLDPIGVPGIWFPFGIGVSRTQYIYAISIPLLAILLVRTLSSDTRSRADLQGV